MKTLIVYFSRTGENSVNGEIEIITKGFTEVVAEKIAKKFQAKIDKKLEEHPQVLGVRPVDFKVTDLEDPNNYELSEFLGTEEDCNKFIEKHPEHDFISKIPYLYEGGKYRVTYWKKV